MMMSDELTEEFSSWKDGSTGTGGEEEGASLIGVNVRITDGFVLTSLIVSLSFTTSVDIRVKNWLSRTARGNKDMI